MIGDKGSHLARCFTRRNLCLSGLQTTFSQENTLPKTDVHKKLAIQVVCALICSMSAIQVVCALIIKKNRICKREWLGRRAQQGLSVLPRDFEVN